MASWPLLECTLKGIKLRQAKSVATCSKSRLTITPNMLKGDPGRKTGTMLTISCYGQLAAPAFFGFLRSGEITVPSMKSYDPGCHLSAGDVTLDSLTSPKAVQIHIKASKTDPFRKGLMVYLGRTNNILCPVGAVTAYLAVRGQSPAHFFRLASWAPLSREMLYSEVNDGGSPAVWCGYYTVLRPQLQNWGSLYSGCSGD